MLWNVSGRFKRLAHMQDLPAFLLMGSYLCFSSGTLNSKSQQAGHLDEFLAWTTGYLQAVPQFCQKGTDFFFPVTNTDVVNYGNIIWYNHFPPRLSSEGMKVQYNGISFKSYKC